MPLAQRGKRITMTIEMDVSVAQALTLQAMFDYWNALASMGSSRFVAFYCDGDGDFRPKCRTSFSAPIPELTAELRQIAVVDENNGNRKYDYDPIAWTVYHDPPPSSGKLLPGEY